MQDLLTYWKENRQHFTDGYKVVHMEENLIFVLCFQEIKEEDHTWMDSWMEEVERSITGKHRIYQLQRNKN